jgi:hypothetical protein
LRCLFVVVIFLRVQFIVVLKALSACKLSLLLPALAAKIAATSIAALGAAVISGGAVVLISLATHLLMRFLWLLVAEALESVDAVRETIEVFQTAATQAPA